MATYSAHEEPRSIFFNIKMIIQSIANALSGYAVVADTSARMLNELADTGLVMAANNKTLVELESQGKKMERLTELAEKYPKLELDV